MAKRRLQLSPVGRVGVGLPSRKLTTETLHGESILSVVDHYFYDAETKSLSRNCGYGAPVVVVVAASSCSYDHHEAWSSTMITTYDTNWGSLRKHNKSGYVIDLGQVYSAYDYEGTMLFDVDHAPLFEERNFRAGNPGDDAFLIKWANEQARNHTHLLIDDAKSWR